jgi:hypothetical protein
VGVVNPGGSGAPTLPLHVAAGGTLADMAAGGDMRIGGGAGMGNLEIAATNIVRVNNGGWIANGGAGILLTSRLANQASDEAAAATAGAGAALPATVQGYKIIRDSGGVDRKIPYYAV